MQPDPTLAADRLDPAAGFDPILEPDHAVVIARYSLCLTGFVLIAAGVMLRGIDVGLHLWIFLSRGFHLIGVFEQDWYFWMIRGGWVAAQLAGPFLLWGRWRQRRWMMLTGVLVAVGLLDLGLWIADAQQRAGQLIPAIEEHQWLRLHLARGVSWVQLGLGAALAATFLDHLGRHSEARGAERIRGLVVVGIPLWLFYFVRQTAWDGWPLVQWGMDGLGLLLLMGYYLPLTLAAVQLMVIDMIAAREANRLIAEWRRHQLHHGTELLRSPSELAEFPAGPGSV